MRSNQDIRFHNIVPNKMYCVTLINGTSSHFPIIIWMGMHLRIQCFLLDSICGTMKILIDSVIISTLSTADIDSDGYYVVKIASSL